MYTDFIQIWLNLENFQVERLISDTLDKGLALIAII